MLLAIDIGNTNINAGLFKGKRLVKRMTCGDGSLQKGDRSLPDILPDNRYLSPSGRAVIVSVSPERLRQVLRLIRKRKLPKPYIIGKDIKVPLKSKYNKKQIGQDRLVTAYAASKLYGRPVLIIDFGTAVTFDIVSKKNEYLGGLILPGIRMSLESLHNKTALLPRVELKKTKGLIGRSTEDSIRLGMIYGYASICEGLVKRFKKQFPRLKVIATGGDARLISEHTASINNIDNNLSLKGLQLISHLLALY